MILYYTPGTCALGPLVFLHQTGLPFHACRVEREQRQQPAYLALNPRGQVPALGLDGRVLTESSAILLHIAARAGEHWLPLDGTEERDAMHFWLSWLDSGFHVAFYAFFKPQRYLPEAADHERLKEAAKPLIRAGYDMLENHLQHHPWMLGAEPSLLDPYAFGMTRWGLRVLGGLDPWPAVAAHRERMLRDPAVQFGLALEEGRAPESAGAFLGHTPLS